MELNEQDTNYISQEIINYYSRFKNIGDYIKETKLSQISSAQSLLPGMNIEDDFFDDFNTNPNDMDIGFRKVDEDTFKSMLDIVSSHTNMVSIPGKNMRYVVYEKNTNKILGFIRLSSPVMFMKPRNTLLGRPLQTTVSEEMSRFNKSVIMGFVIVPTQPFGFNYLGGKLLAAICCTHEVREDINRTYDADICMFETTSLYGTSKSASQYDGMKPFLRYKGLSESAFAPMIEGETFKKFEHWFKSKNDNKPLVSANASSRKMLMQGKMISITKKHLKKYNENKYKEFVDMVENAKHLTEQKRYYTSFYGYSNVPEFLSGKDKQLKKAENYDSFNFDNVINWWKKKASKRHEQLKSENRLRTKLEVWSVDNTDIDIIR